VGIELKIVSLPDDAKDPDELIQKDTKLWQKALLDAEPVVDWVLNQYSKKEDLATAAGKRRFTTAALKVIANLKDEVEQEHYLKIVASKADASVEVLQDKLRGIGSPEVARLRQVAKQDDNVQDESVYQDNLLAVAMIDSATHDLFKDISSDIFIGDNRIDVVEYVKTHGGVAIKDTPDSLQNHDTYVKILLLKADARYADWNDQDRYFETARLLRQVAREHKKKLKTILTEKLRDAETLGDDVQSAKIRADINKLIKEIQSAQK